MNRCDEFNCNKKAHKLLGQCGYCNNYYCMKHRLPEQHNCINLQECKRKAFDDNKRYMKRQKCVRDKISGN